MAKNFGWDACKLSDAYTLAELSGMRLAIENDPANANPAHQAGKSVWLYSASARRKLDALAWAVTYKLNDLRKAA